MKKVFVFSNVQGGGAGEAYAITEDGVIIGSGFCEDEEDIKQTFGINGGNEFADAIYEDVLGDEEYELEFIAEEDVEEHEGLKEAVRQYQVAEFGESEV